MGEVDGEFSLRIYDRWGKLIYEMRSLQDSWDGRVDGKPAPEGAYAYVMEFRACNGRKVSRRGTVTLIR